MLTAAPAIQQIRILYAHSVNPQRHQRSGQWHQKSWASLDGSRYFDSTRMEVTLRAVARSGMGLPCF